MMEFFKEMDPLLQGFWYVAIPVSIIFLIQVVMTFMGADAQDGLSADFDGDLSDGDAPFQLFSFRNLINFLLGFSWTGISVYRLLNNPYLTVIVSLLVGIGFLYGFYLLIKFLIRLGEDNSFKMVETLNKTAEVYLSIPGNRKGTGKIMVSVRGSYRELNAMTNGETIPTNAVVKIVKIENENILIVESI